MGLEYGIALACLKNIQPQYRASDTDTGCKNVYLRIRLFWTHDIKDTAIQI